MRRARARPAAAIPAETRRSRSTERSARRSVGRDDGARRPATAKTAPPNSCGPGESIARLSGTAGPIRRLPAVLSPRTRRGAGGKAAKRLRGRTLDGILVRGYTRGQVVEPPDHEKPARRGWPDAKGNAARSANGECLPRWRPTPTSRRSSLDEDHRLPRHRLLAGPEFRHAENRNR